MDDFLDYCERIKFITENPHEKYSMTVREMLILRQHVAICDMCNTKTKKVISENPRIGLPTENE